MIPKAPHIPDGVSLTTLSEVRRIGRGSWTMIVHEPDETTPWWSPTEKLAVTGDRIVFWRPEEPTTWAVIDGRLECAK